ncbi:dmX-like protein 1 isoform X1 [Micropterus dolomieu]|uniref:dmX-like protein 1 isoform X1 n=1 Tax=Micropterus dolomieu TaxID=147949 RepID=UPI001E8E5993|nr:dmX-like protein 1 isoform X1 [Micropterus dolomieu]XP_045890267.1 dmX-like protein 1 isoform X1 [Micropterus dolomieu]XP_045890269.1 dmX-like protein 1 isoform X1 [Micropterus dolomieu]
MNLHQVLTGAVNPGDNCFSVGSVNNVPFTAYASGCDVVILGSDFERLQIIPGAKHGNIQVGCVDCSLQGRQIAASYGSTVCVFEPVQDPDQKDTSLTTVNCQWQKTGQFVLKSIVRNLAWHPTGSSLLTGSSSLQLWSYIDGVKDEAEDVVKQTDITIRDSLSCWRCIWQSKTASPVSLIKFSPDGEFFATAGQDDCLVKVWYSTSKWKSGVSRLFTPPEPSVSVQGQLAFSFIYLAHPRSVTGFSWRKTSKYMPRGAVCNVLLTCCKDSVCRLWAETLLPGDSLLSGYSTSGQHSDTLGCPGPSSKNSCNGKMQGRTAQELNFQESLHSSFYRDVPQPSLTGCLPHNQSQHYNHKKSSSIMPHANALCHFHIAASINPATDIPLLPSISSLSAVDDEEPGGPFTVHWLNNKELHFTLAMEVFLQQLRGSLEQRNSGCSHEEPEDEDNFHEDNSTRPSDPEAGELPLAAVKHQVDVLLEEWNKGADMLFSIHPMDGSLLVWHVDWLDEYQPGMFRQAQVSFVSRIPVAFPTGDAISLSHSVVMYACNKNVDLAIQHGRQRPPGSTLPQTKSALISYGGQGKAAPSSSLRLSIFTPNVLMISKHADGSLNQWAVSFAEDSAFSTVLSVSHKSRYCGHRFHLNDLACHSLLPLLLTTSHHNALRTPEADNILTPPDTCSSGFSHSTSLSRGSRPSRVSLGMVSQDPNAIYSELILWRVDPVGPLSLSGGVSELARINSLHASAFANVAWLPTLIPSSCLGVYCNSPSACFVASDGHSLRLYQAVIEAKKLLSELSNPEISKYVGEVFNIISQQSTAKPGCIIELDVITGFQGKETQLLHVFEEDLILGSERAETTQETPDSPHTASSEPAFSARFFLVVVELTPAGRSLLHMWHLHLAAQPVTMEDTTTEKDAATASPMNSSQFNFDTFSSPVTQKSKPCTSNLQSASRLNLTTHRLYSQEMALPEGVEAISVTPAAGHLSASCSLPARRVPYLFATSCSDGKVRFWRCNVIATNPSSMDNLVYQWEEWPLLVEERFPNSSGVSVQGRPIEISCCHTGRIAVAYRQMPNAAVNSLNCVGPTTSPPTLASSPNVHYNSSMHLTPTLTVQRSPNIIPSPNPGNAREPLVHIGIFQCESTGGSQWILEQTIVLDSTDPTANYGFSNSTAGSTNEPSNKDSLIPNENCHGYGSKSLVHLDWVSQENGSHVLTVGIGTKIYMYGCLSGKPPELGLSSDASRDKSLSRLVLLRSVDLVSSVEGSLPIPVSLSWVRDGILVVGMDCEMHVYSQWQPPAPPKPNAPTAQDTDISSSLSSIISAVRQSQEEGLSSGAPMSSLAPPKKALTRSMMSLAQKLSGKRTAYDLPVEMEDSGLFEAAQQLFPTLPQYHPVQLLELMDLGKVHRAKAILSHLVKCIAGEIVALKDGTSNPEKRVRSRTISAGGSTARDQKMFRKAENSTPDYTEISSIPPLPLYALLAADEDTLPKPEKVGSFSGDSGHGSSHTDAYDELFQTPSMADLDPLDKDEEELGNKVIDLSQYSPTYFGPEHAQVLSSHLLHSSLPGLTSMEQMSLMALADTIATTSTDLKDSQSKSKGGETLDECGLKFLLAVRLHTFLSTSLPPAHRVQLLQQGLSTCHYAWAFHSEAEEELLNMLPALQKGEPTWPELRSMGVGWWLRSTNKLRRCIEKVARASLQRNNDPLDAAIFYLALKKKAVVWGLYRSQKNAKMTDFFRNNFSEDRWRKAALKNAFSLLGKQRFQHSAAFFLLAGSLKDAVEVCLEKMQDLQLALVISRLYESEFETNSTYKKILQRHVLGQDKQIQAHHDPFLRSMAHWVLEDYSRALDTLLDQPANSASSASTESKCDAGPSPVSTCNPEVFNFYTYLRTHPLLLRRHFGSSDKAKVGLTAEGRRADSISLEERRLFFTAAYAHMQAGCPMLALEVLCKMPKVRKHSKLPNQADTSITAESVGSKNGKTSDPDWSQSALNDYKSQGSSLSNSQSDSLLSFDWSQPSLTLPDESLELKWDSDKDDEDDEGEDEIKNGGRPVESSSVFQDTQDAMSPLMETGEDSEDGNDFLAPSDDILAAQLKFTACLKIMTNELRTLSTGYELDGGKLRYQLYQWLEREVVALQHCCSYKPCLPELSVQGDAPVSGLVEEERPGSPRGDSQRSRRHWLQSNQPLLRMFLSYCSLHGSHGGGLASVRMELILLLQESHQDDSIQSAVTPCSEQTSIPLLMACTANVKTVVANPIVYLTNLTHDILQTINALDSPPHPDVVNNEIYVMHTLAASLSACIYQCLCDGHTHSHVNHFTGIIYQSVLLSQKQQVRTVSMDESVQPNTSPSQWPGIASLIRLLSSAGEESQPGLTVLLCEILTAVFLSLFVHGMATHSSNELFRIVAHPLSSKLWVTVFGGGARTPVMEKSKSPTRTPSPASPSGSDRKSRRFRLLSSRSVSREESPSSPKHGPVVDQEAAPIFKERFVPPELSIWDYFIAKPSLPPSESRIEYDSEDSQGSEDEDEDDEFEDVFDPNSPQREHSNHNSYSWCLMRLAMVQLVLVNLKSFYPMAGYDLLDLPVGSPLCHAVLKTLQRWEQVLLKRLEIFGGPPAKYISTQFQDETAASGPALLRHKALFEPSNTPFRTSHTSSLPVKRLWQFLVKQEEVQETFIRHIFTKKRDPNESGEDQTDNMKCSGMEETGNHQTESDQGCPGGKARIIHKESDIITAFAINKANRNCLVMASTHDIQELDVSSILATQILTWIDDDDAVAEAKSDDFLVVHARNDFATLHGTTPYTHSSPGTPINMPWLGGLQTGRGASVMIKRNINNVRRMTSHPTLPYYLTGAQDGSVRMFEWGHSQQIICFRSPGNSRVTRIRFNHQGNKFGIVDADGGLSLWQTNTSGNAPKPYLTLQCHNKTAHDFVFVGSSSLIATAGLSSDNRNVCMWDTLVTPANSLVHAFCCHESGATVLSMAPRQQLLITGGRKGWISILELPHRHQRQSFQAHDSPVKALAVDPTEDCFISGSSEGNIKIWSLTTQCPLYTFPNEHSRQSLFRNLGTGVMQIEVGPNNHIFSCGADGTMKMRVLPNRFNVVNNNNNHDNLKNDVKFII